MKAFKALQGLVSGELKIINTLIAIIKLEARLAGSSIVPLLVNLMLLFLVLLTTWVAAVVILSYVMIAAFDNVLASLLVILLLHIGILLGLVKYLQFNLKSMSFEKTRAFFSTENNNNDHLEKAIACPYREDGTDITPSSN